MPTACLERVTALIDTVSGADTGGGSDAAHRGPEREGWGRAA